MENFLKQKLKNVPDLVGAGQVRSGLGPYPGVLRSVEVQGAGQTAVVPWLIQLKIGRYVTHMEEWPKRYLGSYTPHPLASLQWEMHESPKGALTR